MLSWLYPITCRVCGEVSERCLCADCLAAMPQLPTPICLYCGAPVGGNLQDAYHCAACKAKPRPFDVARSALLANDATMPLIHQLKYQRAIYLAAAFAPALLQVWQAHPEFRTFEKSAAIVPVPINRTHLYTRGYNQAEELARSLSRLVGVPVVQPLLRQETAAHSQTGLSAAQRLQNAYAAYHPLPAYASGKKKLPPHLVLVDDVYTTGATVRACAAALKRLPGIRKIAVLTLLRVQ
ncbi:MAG: ComF family protein [Akkermansiaceae bacterium]|nr:ComF family protein [Akkermansiaceae bacterium]